MHPDKPAHAMVRAGLELLGLRPAVEDEVNGPLFMAPSPPVSPPLTRAARTGTSSGL